MNQPPLAVIGEEIDDYKQFIPKHLDDTKISDGNKVYAHLNIDVFPDGQPHETLNLLVDVLDDTGIFCTVTNGTLQNCNSILDG